MNRLILREKENVPLTHPLGEYVILHRDRTCEGTRYAISMNLNSFKPRTVCVTVRGCHANVEGELNIIEESIMHNALSKITGNNYIIHCINRAQI